MATDFGGMFGDDHLIEELFERFKTEPPAGHKGAIVELQKCIGLTRTARDAYAKLLARKGQ